MSSVRSSRTVQDSLSLSQFHDSGSYTSYSNQVRLLIDHEESPDVPAAVAYHIAVCSKPAPIWNDLAVASLLSYNSTCESVVSTNASIDLIREPWTLYEVSVTVCYGAFDSLKPVNLSLPVFKQIPDPLTDLSWSQQDALLSWKYESSPPSGFLMSVCVARAPPDSPCTSIMAGPLDRQYHVGACYPELKCHAAFGPRLFYHRCRPRFRSSGVMTSKSTQ